MIVFRKFVLTVIVLLFTLPAYSNSVKILRNSNPLDTTYSDIGTAVTNAANGDVLLVGDGAYNESIDYDGLAITIRSENGPANCMIICPSGSDHVVSFISGETSSSVLSGFTIMNGNDSGIYCLASSPAISNCIIKDNTNEGVSCTAQSNPTITNCTITGSTIAGINCSYSSPTISNCTISNIAGNGIYIDFSYRNILPSVTSSANITSCIIKNNTGSGILCNGSSPVIDRCTISGNSQGGIYCNAESYPVIRYSGISSNSSTAESTGGGVTCLFPSNPILYECTIDNNTSTYNGGGILCDKSNPEINGCTITSNTATVSGGGIYCNGASPEIVDCIISNNSAASESGIYCLYNSSPEITNCIISANTSTDTSTGGGITCSYSSSPSIINCTISRNTGYGIYCNDSSPVITNCILWNDSSGELGNFNSSFSVITYSDVKDGYTGEGNIDSDPKFVDPEKGDYQLKSGSPCIDSGTSTGAPAMDINGDGRPYDDDYDMGIFEGPGVKMSTEEESDSEFDYLDFFDFCFISASSKKNSGAEMIFRKILNIF